jgi:hypothetical protein
MNRFRKWKNSLCVPNVSWCLPDDLGESSVISTIVWSRHCGPRWPRGRPVRSAAAQRHRDVGKSCSYPSIALRCSRTNVPAIRNSLTPVRHLVVSWPTVEFVFELNR